MFVVSTVSFQVQRYPGWNCNVLFCFMYIIDEFVCLARGVKRGCIFIAYVVAVQMPRTCFVFNLGVPQPRLVEALFATESHEFAHSIQNGARSCGVMGVGVDLSS